MTNTCRSPISGNENENALNTSGRSVMMCRVGPRHTEYESTIGISSATSATQSAVSKKPRNQNATVVAAPSFAKFARTSRPAKLEATASAVSPIAIQSSRFARRSGSATQTSANTAGMSTNATKSTSALVGRFGRSRKKR